MDYSVTPATRELDAALRRKIDQKTKPLGALGHLEALALQMGRVRGTLTPTLAMPHIVVLAGDHGAAKAGISAYPQEVTWQMVENFLAGGAAINVFARANDIGLTIVDAGVAHDFGARENLVDAKVSRGGTLSYLDGAAMSAEQRDIAMTKGAEIARKLAAEGCTVVGFGEMGIGNTASASLITHCLTELPLAACIGRGTGLDDAGLARKQALLEQALVLVDGFICGAAALTAARICPDFLDYAVFCHASAEAGHRAQLGALNVSPLITLDLRLGEGTGAALAWPLVRAACAFLNEMASFESAGVSEKL